MLGFVEICCSFTPNFEILQKVLAVSCIAKIVWLKFVRGHNKIAFYREKIPLLYFPVCKLSLLRVGKSKLSICLGVFGTVIHAWVTLVCLLEL